MGDFQGGFERFPEIFPHRREREKNAEKQIVRIDNQSIIHKTLHLLTIEPRRGPMLEKRKRVRDASIYASKKYRSSFYS